MACAMHRLAVAGRAVDEHRFPGAHGRTDRVEDAVAEHQVTEGGANPRRRHVVHRRRAGTVACTSGTGRAAPAAHPT